MDKISAYQSEIPLKKLLHRLIALCILPLLLLAVWLVFDHIRDKHQELDRNANNLAHNFASIVNKYLDSHIKALSMLAASPLLDDPSRWGDFYQEVQGFYASFGSHVILSDIGEPMQMLLNTRSPFGASLPPLPRPQGRAAAPIALKTMQPAVGDSFLGPIANKSLVAVVVPVIREDKPKFLLLSTFESLQFQERFNELALPTGWAVTLFDSVSNVIAHRGSLSHDANTAESYTIEAAVSLNTTPWRVSVIIPPDIHKVTIFNSGIALSLGILIAAVISILAGFVVSRRLGVAVQALAKGTNHQKNILNIKEFKAARRIIDETLFQLHQSEERFRSMAEFAPVGIVLLDNNEKVIFLNQHFLRLVGFTIEEIPTIEQWWSLTFPDPQLREIVKRDWSSAMENTEILSTPIKPAEYPVTCRDGSIKFIEFRKRSIGSLICVILTDISRRKKAEDDALESAKDLQITLNSIGDAVITTDIQGRVTRMNPVAETLTGWLSQEAEHQSLEQILVIIHAETGEPVENPVEKVVRTRRIVGLANHTKLLERNGKEYHIADSAAPVVDDEGNMRGVVLVFRDVTESYYLREAIQRERNILHLFVRYAPAAIAMIDTEMRYLAVSERFLIDYGIKNPEITGRSHYEIFPDVPERWKEIHRRCLAGAVERCDEDPFPRADGKTDWVRWEIRPWHESSGKIGGIILFSEVITERKRSEERIEHINRVMNAVRLVNKLIVYEKDRSVLLQKACDLLINTRGYRTAWAVAFNNQSQVVASVASGFGEDFPTFLATMDGGVMPFCYNKVREAKTGVIVILNTETMCTPCTLASHYPNGAALVGALRNNDRNHGILAVALPGGMADDQDELSLFAELASDLGYALDSLEQQERRNQAEEALILSEQRRALALEAAQAGTWEWDLRTNENVWSRELWALYGLEPFSCEASYDAWLKTVHPEDRSKPVEIIKEAVSKGKAFSAEWRVASSDDTERWLMSRGRPLKDSDDQVVRYLGIVIDNTERRRVDEERRILQAQLTQAQKMEAIGTLAGGIAHDFNNILGAILGFAEMARESSPSGSHIAHDLDRILEAGKRAANLVKQILAFSRDTSAELVLLQPLHLVKEALKLLRPALPSTITIKQQLDATTKPILADPTQVHQIVMNLCTNAFHAMEQTGGILEITLNDSELSLQDCLPHPGVQPGKFVKLSIGDTGPGIAPEIRNKIFQPYFTTKEIGKGTGMGLAIVHGIVTAMGGFINYDSELGKGTTIHVFFPAKEQEVASIIQSTEMVLSGKERILFIDDEEILAEMGKTMLERLGYKVTVRTSSIDALTTFQNHPDQFDAVITDQTMPGITGFDLARRMLQIRPDIPIILCTGYSNLITEEQAKSVGIKGFIMKPMSKKDIAKLLRTVLENK